MSYWFFQLDDEPNLYIKNGCFTKHPLKNVCLGLRGTWQIFGGPLYANSPFKFGGVCSWYLSKS